MEKKLTRAEERALEVYPHYTAENLDDVIKARKFFAKGYEQAEKDTIERAVTWLKDNANKYIVDLTETYPDAPVNIIVGGICWVDLAKYLKDNEKH